MQPWLANYSAGVPAEIELEFESLSDMFDYSASRFADKTACSSFGKALAFQALQHKVERLAAWLQQQGIGPGYRVALMLPNILQFPIGLFAILKTGATVVNVNPLYTARELRHQLVDSQASAIIVMENFASVLQQVIADTAIRQVIVTAIGDELGLKGKLMNAVVRYWKRMVPPYQLPQVTRWQQVMACQAPLTAVSRSHQDLAFLQYTGGTTGLAKGAMLSHGNLLANVQQVQAWVQNAMQEGDEIIIAPLPLYHIFALVVNCLAFIRLGCELVLIANPRDLPAFIKILRQRPFTCMVGVNTLFNALLNTPGFTELDFSRLKFVIGGGSSVQRPVAERWQQLTGKPLLEGYGLTEASPVVSCNPLHLGGYNGTVGLPLPSTQISLRDDQEQPVALSAAGELCIKGPQVMQGYWQQPEETRKVFTADGWLKTGDIAQVDAQGFIRILDRKKDLILVSGFNVYPNEIEEIVCQHPGVREAAVIGVASDKTGEMIKLFVVKAQPELTESEILAHCRQYLTSYKVPKQVEFRAELPKTNVGKILRRELKNQ